MKNLLYLSTGFILALSINASFRKEPAALPTLAPPLRNEVILENPKHNIVQLALLLDVSGSMDGLIDQAKSELWTVVNEVAKAKKAGHNTSLEIALYEYGRTDNPATNGYIVKLLDYTSDLDTISKILFSLHTNGGEEYCGHVIKNALEELQWRNNDSIYRVIFIAGNEPFNQGNVDYKSSCTNAYEKGIIINTIHCGDYMTGLNSHWKTGAEIGKGEYFHIDQNAKGYDIKTPYDSMINVYNDSLNTTYWAFGDAGMEYKSNQAMQDLNAASMSPSVKAKRAFSKTNAVYNNQSWDAVDAVKADSTWLKKADDKDLPEQLKGKPLKEKEELLSKNTQSRTVFIKKIQELNLLREAYIRDHQTDKSIKTLGMALVEAIHKQAGVKGFKFE